MRAQGNEGRLGRRFAIVIGLAVTLGTLSLAAVAFAADEVTSADLSTDASLPTEVGIGDNGFEIALSATGQLRGGKTTGELSVVTKYTMATDGTITPSGSPSDVQVVNFTTGLNYGDGHTKGCAVNPKPLGCAPNPHVVNATLVVAAGTPDGTNGNFVISPTGSSGLIAHNSPPNHVEVTAPPNHAPEVSAEGPSIINPFEGSLIDHSGAFSDQDNDSLTLSLGAGDGGFLQGSPTAPGGGFWSWLYVLPDDGLGGPVTVTADDGHGGTATYSFGWVGQSEHPNISGFKATTGSNCEASVSFVVDDPGSADTEDVYVDWGDGNGFERAVSGVSAGSKVDLGPHTYDADPGPFFVITAYAIDDEGENSEIAGEVVSLFGCA